MADISGYLQNIRNGARGEDVRDSIINALDKINKDNPSIIRPLNVTANGTYAGEGGVVYNPVTVNVPEGASQALSLTDINITENGEYEPDDGAAYRNITVEVPQYVNEIMTDEKVVYLEEGDKVYYALDDGYDGYSAVHVMSGSGGGGGGATYTVNFMLDENTLYEAAVGVPFGGGAVCRKPDPTSPGMRFVGWNPNPINVKSNMTCYPRFENMLYDPNQILDDWITIAKKCQENPNAYNIGQWKALELNEFTYPEGSTNPRDTHGPVQLQVQLVAKGVDKLEGETGYANTTWMIKFPTIQQPEWEYMPNPGSLDGWPSSGLRDLFHSTFTSMAFPQTLLKYIKRVIKYTCCKNEQGTVVETDKPTVDWFWIPSIRELIGGCTDYDSYINGYGEHSGPSYDIYSHDPTTGDALTVAASQPLRDFQAITPGATNRTCIRSMHHDSGYQTWYIFRDGSFGYEIYGGSSPCNIMLLGFCI